MVATKRKVTASTSARGDFKVSVTGDCYLVRSSVEKKYWHFCSDAIVSITEESPFIVSSLFRSITVF